MNKIQELKKQGYKIRVAHQRFVQGQKVKNGIKVTYKLELISITQKNRKHHVIHCKGGLTTVDITAPDGRNVTGIAKCHPSDPFVRRTAVSMALGRALKQLEEKKKEFPIQIGPFRLHKDKSVYIVDTATDLKEMESFLKQAKSILND